MKSPSDPQARVLELEELNARQAKVLEGLRGENTRFKDVLSRIERESHDLGAGNLARAVLAGEVVPGNTPLRSAATKAVDSIDAVLRLLDCVDVWGEGPGFTKGKKNSSGGTILSAITHAQDARRHLTSPPAVTGTTSDSATFRQPDEPFETPEQRKARGDAIQAFNEEQEANMYACITPGCDGGTRNAGDYCHKCAAPQAGGSP